MLTKAQVVTMMNHINNTARASLNGRTPFELASLLLPDTLLRWSGAAPAVVYIGVIDAQPVLLDKLPQQRFLVLDALGWSLALILL